MVIGHFLVVAHLFCVDSRGRCHTTDSGGRRNKAADAVLHILGQKAAVCTGVGTELLFIEGLEIIKGLLGGVAQDAVCITLERGKIIECWGFFCLFLSLHRFHDCRFTLAGVGNTVCGFSVLHSVCRGDKAAIKGCSSESGIWITTSGCTSFSEGGAVFLPCSFCVVFSGIVFLLSVLDFGYKKRTFLLFRGNNKGLIKTS